MEIPEMERSVILASIRLYFTDGSDDSRDGDYMRFLYANHREVTTDLVRAYRVQKEAADVKSQQTNQLP
jgi:hypothetical protein